jgi:hypothetical protein
MDLALMRLAERHETRIETVNQGAQGEKVQGAGWRDL